MVSILSFKDIAKIFEEIELRLISSLKRNLKRHKAEEQRYGFEWSAWQAEKLKNMESFRRENLDIMNEYVDVIDDQTRQLMTEQFQEGQQQAQRSAQELSDEPITPIPDKHFFGVNEKKMAKLMEDVTTLEKTAETAALRMTDDIYRQTLNRVQLAMGTGSMTLNEAIDLATKDFLDKGINCIVYADGKRVNIADYVRMALRTTSTRAALQGAAKRFAELGYDTVLVSQYGGCSKTCEPWQGQVYIDDVFTVWEGEKDEFQGKSNYCGEWFWLLSYAVKNGLFHPNCRHTMTQYIHGRTQIPEQIPAEKIKEQRKLEQKQRAMERKIRKLKRFAAGTLDPDTAKAYRRKLRQAQHELKVFVEEHNEVLHRDHSREKYYGGGVDKSGKSGIIEVDKDTLKKYLGKPITQADSQHVREWYYANVTDIPNQIDKTKPFEEQVKQAFELRNYYKHEARVAMSDKKTAMMLDEKRPAPTFEKLLKDKMKRKNMTKDEALKDILETASKTNDEVNKNYGL